MNMTKELNQYLTFTINDYLFGLGISGVREIIESVVVGLLVDSVQEVIVIEPEQITPPPRKGVDINSTFVNGMGGRDDGFIVILDVDQLFAADVADSFQGTHEIDTSPQDMDIVSEVTV